MPVLLPSSATAEAHAMVSVSSSIARPSSVRLLPLPAPRFPPVASKCFFHCAASGTTTRVCELKIWMLEKLKWRKNFRTHGWEKKPRMLQVQDSVEETTSNSEVAESSPPNVQPIIPKYLESSTESSSSSAYGNSVDRAPSLCIAVVGATGELARNKIFPALFALYYSGFLPENVGIFGYSRKDLSDEDLRNIVAATLTCRVDHHENCGDKLDAFLDRTYHINGGFNNKDGMKMLNRRMEQIEGEHEANRIFYLSVPQEALLDVSVSLADNSQTKRGWNRIIIEKPFGFDALSSHKLTQCFLSKFQEKQLYRIDHRLGKDLIENITVLRFSNLVFEPLWSRTYIKNVQVIFSEECGMEAQGRYFGHYGVIRDIVHSHILQTIALFAMEPPVSLDGEDIRNEKVKVLRSIRKLNLDDVVLGQYKNSADKSSCYMNSLTPTFFAAALYIDNARWDGVPFLVKTGVGLIKHRVEIRIQFHHVPGNLYRERISHNIDLTTNELILRDQPDEAILLKVNNKVPGLGLQLDASELNLLYRDKYNVEVPDSYEHLLLDVIDGDNHLFMRSDELEAAWNILTPILDKIEENKVVPELYEIGGRGPVGAYYLGANHGVRWADD
ncbi:inactive glucose-6-phosphate 1-dehydrogenase 4, chloroplastic-like isoform X1 [Musa acuminata AAA Group]|uniref:inactive glucose-6-phosphate 1-dehydrogenase 4, chloroplastic-like isoform X1 n=1 Tax=Musa acuminata AAA Group TaxID=214697 RepID=UPI0031CE32CE